MTGPVKTKKQRIVTYDLMRGYFLLVILINHLHRFPGFFDIFTGQAVMWGSVAEGFFLISGLLIGKIRRGYSSQTLDLQVLNKFIKRAGMLYAISAVLSITFTLIGWQLLSQPGLKPDIYQGNFVSMLGHLLTLQYVYGWADFLIYFSVYLFFTPLAWILLLTRKAWALALLCLVLFMFRNHNSYFIWQIYFFGGLILGYYLNDLGAIYKKQTASARRLITAAMLVLTAVTLTASVFARMIYPILDAHNNFGVPHFEKLRYAGQVINAHTYTIFDRWHSYGAGRPFIVILWFWALYYIFARYEKFILRFFGKILLPMGRNSFATYIIESIVLFFCSFVLATQDKFLANFTVNCLAIALTLLMLFGFIKYKTLLREIVYKRTGINKISFWT